MGKRTRRKRNNNSSNKNNQHAKSNPNKEEKDDNSTNSSLLLQRIRHADPRTRHAALAAVANTLLDTSRPTPPKVSNALLQAIRERVLDADLDVCQVAAGCLANYVTLVGALDQTIQMEATQSMTAGWTLVLVGRLKQCYEQLTKSKQASSSAKVKKQWLALAAQCLRTLCLLMETNPEAVGRLTSSMDATPRQEFHQTLFEWMQHGQQYFSSASAKENSDSSSSQFYPQIVVLSARTLHSAWDDNADLLLPWKEECPDAFRSGMELLETVMKHRQPTGMPVVAQLHAMGAFLTARPFVSSQQAVTITQQTVLPHLTHQLGQFSWTTAQNLLKAYQQANQVWEEEQADDALEKDVIRRVQEKKEPARQIARRQKAQKKEAAAASDAKKEPQEMQEEAKKPAADDAAMKDDDDAEEQHKQQVETQAALEQTRDAWNRFLLPLQLSLELLANLTSGAVAEEPEDEEMMMDEDWGPDQEAQWMQEQEQQQVQQNQQRQSAEEEALQKLLLESALPQQLMQLSQQVYHVPQDLVFPEQSRNDLEDLQSKTMACLGNCWENIPQWPAQVSWAELQQAATNATGMGKEGLVSAMVVALRTYSSVRKEWQPDHVTFWLNELGNSQTSGSAVRRDIITMLGILCSQEPHPAEVNQKICSALLSALTNDSSESVMIPCEVLNALMDMYGGDDDDGCCHGNVFESLQVLGHFQRNIPTLKQRLKQQERKGADKVEIEQWKETLLNGSRFVQYKKGQL